MYFKRARILIETCLTSNALAGYAPDPVQIYPLGWRDAAKHSKPLIYKGPDDLAIHPGNNRPTGCCRDGEAICPSAACAINPNAT